MPLPFPAFSIPTSLNESVQQANVLGKLFCVDDGLEGIFLGEEVVPARKPS